MDDFFEDKNKTDETPKVKVGDKEYTQEELSGLVGLGETAKEYETKWNRKISEFYPDYTQKSQRLSELEKKDAERARVADEQLKREQEEKDFYQWSSVLREEGDPCLDIMNSELREACSKGAKFFSSDDD